MVTSHSEDVRAAMSAALGVHPELFTVAFVEAQLRRHVAEFGLITLIEPNALAYALVRLGESFLYAGARGSTSSSPAPRPTSGSAGPRRAGSTTATS